MQVKTKRAPRTASRHSGFDRSMAELSELDSWIEAGYLPELNPTRQARSLRTTLALLAAGAKLLRTGSLEELSVQAVCQEAGLTVGSFYGRFEGKDAFFLTMQRIQVLRSGRTLSELEAKSWSASTSIEKLCRELVEAVVERFNQDAGVLRASLQHTREGMWEPFRQLGDRYRAVLIARVAPRLEQMPASERELRVQFAFQALTGTVVHALLNNPGPLVLDDPRLVTELTRSMRAYLTAK